MSDLQKMVDDKISNKKVMMFSKSRCPYCNMAKKALGKYNLSSEEYEIMELDKTDKGEAIQRILQTKTGARTVPRVFINGKCIGGGDETAALDSSGKLMTMLKGN